jgi:transposase
MSLKPQKLGPIPEVTARVARAAYPKGNVWMQMRDELGTMYQDEAFAHLFSHTGQPAEARLSLSRGHRHAVCRRTFRSSGC